MTITPESPRVTLLEVNLSMPDRLVLPGWLAELIGLGHIVQVCGDNPRSIG